MTTPEKRFLVGEAADDRLRVVYSELGTERVERIVLANQEFDFFLKSLGIDPETMRLIEGAE